MSLHRFLFDLPQDMWEEVVYNAPDWASFVVLATLTKEKRDVCNRAGRIS